MKRHPFDLLSFAAGIAFVTLAVTLLVSGDDVVDQARWLWPVLLIVVGAAGLYSAWRRDDEEPEA